MSPRVAGRLLACLLSLPAGPWAHASRIDTPLVPHKDGRARPGAFEGTSTTLRVSTSSQEVAWIVFDASTADLSAVEGATLKLYVGSLTSPGHLQVHALRSAPTGPENAIDLAALDYDTVALASVRLGASDLEALIALDVTAAARVPGSVGFVLASDDGLRAVFGSKESTMKPTLELEYAGLTASEVAQLQADAAGASASADAARQAKGEAVVSANIAQASANAAASDAGSAQSASTRADDAALRAETAASAAAVSATQAGNAASGDRGALAFYDFNAKTGTTASDGSGNGNTLAFAPFGATYTGAGHALCGLLLDGASGYARANDARTLNPYRELTISAWVYLQSDAGALNTIVAKPGQYQLAIVGAAGQRRLAFGVQGVAGPPLELLGTGAVPEQAWTFVQASYDGRFLRLAVDGTLTALIPYSHGPIAISSTTLFVGAADTSAGFFKGVLDDLRLQSYVVDADGGSTPVGTVLASLLSEAQFQARNGSGWVLADGRDVTGSAYADLTGAGSVPDLRGLFLRGRNNGRSDGRQNPAGDLALGAFQADQVTDHKHAHTDGGHSHGIRVGGYDFFGGPGIDYGPSLNNVSVATSASHANISVQGANTPLSGSVGNETRPRNATVNYFVRIN